mgnify:CR=1 FL=1
MANYATVAEVKSYLDISGTDDDTLLGTFVASASKKIDEFIGYTFEVEYGVDETQYNVADMDIVVLRVSNGYGYPVFNYPKCWKLIINSFCYQAYHQKKIKIKSKSNFIKNFVDMNYLIKVLKFFNYYPKRVNGIYNIGSKDNLSIYDMAKNVKKIAEKNKLSNIKILTEFSNKETNINFFYSIKKLLDLGCVVKESRKNEINNIFRYLKKNG